jgi:hypothetical protein
MVMNMGERYEKRKNFYVLTLGSGTCLLGSSSILVVIRSSSRRSSLMSMKFRGSGIDFRVR